MAVNLVEKKSFILVDGSSYLFRAYHAMPPLVNAEGKPTGAIYGVINMLRRLIKETQPHPVTVVFDTKQKNFRHELFPDYKANRAEMPEDLAEQIAPLHRLIQAMGLPLVAVPGIEADDVIATLAFEAKTAGYQVVISTGDKDFAQLVGEDITLVNTMTNTIMDEAAVLEKFGVQPNQIIDYLALVGDSVDNVPGIPKVGPKTAQKWLNTYGSLDNLITHQQELPGKVGENFRTHLSQLALSKALVTIRHDFPLPVSFAALQPAPPETDTLMTLFKQLGFNSWLKDLDSLSAAEQKVSDHHYVCITEKQQLQDWIDKLHKADYIAIDTETTGLDPFQARLVGISLSVQPGEAAYLPIAHDYEGAPLQLPFGLVYDLLQPIFGDKTKRLIGHNLKFDYQVLMQAGFILPDPFFDTMVASYVLNSVSSRHDLKSVVKQYLNEEMLTYESITQTGNKQVGFEKVALTVATQYSAADADMALRLYHYFSPLLTADSGLNRVFYEIDMPLVPVLIDMEQTGIQIDCDLLATQSTSLAQKLEKLEEQIFCLAGESFNINSPKQLQTILYEKLNLPMLQKTPTGQPSTAEPVLAELAKNYELPKLILEYRSYQKLKSTYTDKLPLQVNAKTKRVHTSYHQAITATGRLSSSDPNLQNIPIRTEEGRQIRKAFITTTGWQLLSADYSQVELRIMAHLSKDKGLLAAFQANEDIHARTASEIFGVPLDAVTKDQRRHAKAVNFGLIYGMSAFGLANQIESNRETAQSYIDHYFERFPGVKTYMEETRAKAHEHGCVETLFGRKLQLPDIRSKNLAFRRQAERAAINAPMQGTAADIIKIAMRKIHVWCESHSSEIRLLLQVHDELIFEVKQSFVETARLAIREMMQTVDELNVPLLVEIGVGSNWDEAH